MRTHEITMALGSAGFLAATALGAGWNARISPKGDSGISGSATIEQAGGGAAGSAATPAAAAAPASYQATVSVTGATAGSTLAWQVQEGRCSAPSGAVGSGSAYPAIKVDDQGAGQATAKVPAELDPTKSYSVSVSGGGSVLGCGDFSGGE